MVEDERSSKDYLIDANDVVWWTLIGLVVGATMLLVQTLDISYWWAIPIGVIISLPVHWGHSVHMKRKQRQ